MLHGSIAHLKASNQFWHTAAKGLVAASSESKPLLFTVVMVFLIKLVFTGMIDGLSWGGIGAEVYF